MYKKSFIFCIIGLFWLSLLTIAWAHATVLWSYIEKNHVYVEAFFMGGKKIKNGDIFVVDSSGKTIIKGKTDTDGLFQFVPPIQEDMTIVIRLDKGHGSEFKLTKQDFLDAAETDSAKKE